MDIFTLINEAKKFHLIALQKKENVLSQKYLVNFEETKKLRQKLASFTEVKNDLIEQMEVCENSEWGKLHTALKVMETNIQNISFSIQLHENQIAKMSKLNHFVIREIKSMLDMSKVSLSLVKVKMTKSFRKNYSEFIEKMERNGFLLAEDRKNSRRSHYFYATVNLNTFALREFKLKLSNELFLDYSLVVGNFSFTKIPFLHFDLLKEYMAPLIKKSLYQEKV